MIRNWRVPRFYVVINDKAPAHAFTMSPRGIIRTGYSVRSDTLTVDPRSWSVLYSWPLILIYYLSTTNKKKVIKTRWTSPKTLHHSAKKNGRRRRSGARNGDLCVMDQAAGGSASSCLREVEARKFPCLFSNFHFRPSHHISLVISFGLSPCSLSVWIYSRHSYTLTCLIKCVFLFLFGITGHIRVWRRMWSSKPSSASKRWWYYLLYYQGRLQVDLLKLKNA